MWAENGEGIANGSVATVVVQPLRKPHYFTFKQKLAGLLIFIFVESYRSVRRTRLIVEPVAGGFSVAELRRRERKTRPTSGLAGFSRKPTSVRPMEQRLERSRRSPVAGTIGDVNAA